MSSTEPGSVSTARGGARKIEPGEGRRHLGVLLRTGWHGFLDELFTRLAAEGFDDLRPAHSPVFQHLERDGTRIGVLAERAQMTNQSMGYLVDALESRGYVERRPDPGDRRAALVVITDRGRAQIAAARRQIADIEREWEERIGSQRMTALREGLQALAASLDGDTERRAERQAAGPAAGA
ncbi:MAG: MarR family transcriptional regulator [Chloroflexota bacterium]|nr:MarR family transcriptional regulator [Chloroflexota bacterium]